MIRTATQAQTVGIILFPSFIGGFGSLKDQDSMRTGDDASTHLTFLIPYSSTPIFHHATS